MSETAWVHRLFAAIDAKRIAEFVGFLAEDARFRFANNPPVRGREAISQAVEAFFGSIRASRHRLDRIWDADGAVVCIGEVTYTRLDGGELTLPFADVFVMNGRQIGEYLIYIDIGPLYAPMDL